VSGYGVPYPSFDKPFLKVFDKTFPKFYVELKKYVIIAADGATSVLMKNGITPEIIVTDLDGNMDDEAKAGAIMVVHAHGDNMEALKRYVPEMKNVIGTTQSRPLWNVYNFGGFTDGDRCVFLAKEFGAKSITLIGFDFDDENVTPMKKKKLAWAKRLIDMVMGGAGAHQIP